MSELDNIIKTLNKKEDIPIISKGIPKRNWKKLCRYMTFNRVDEPLEQAFKYFYQAAEQNDKEGFFGLGECYAYGWGVEKDFEKAKFYFAKAKGEKYSIERMKEIETESSEKVLEVIRDVYN